jgi:hypothetical protein
VYLLKGGKDMQISRRVCKNCTNLYETEICPQCRTDNSEIKIIVKDSPDIPCTKEELEKSLEGLGETALRLLAKYEMKFRGSITGTYGEKGI